MEERHGDDGRIQGLPFLQKIATLVNDKSLERIKLDACRFDVEWHYPSIEVSGLAIEEKGKFRAEGEVIVRKGSLRGTVDLGIAPALLEFLTAPVVKEVFPREKNGYLWTTVHLSGTIEDPQLDLSRRLMEAISEHPTAMLKIYFHRVGESLAPRRRPRLRICLQKHSQKLLVSRGHDLLRNL